MSAFRPRPNLNRYCLIPAAALLAAVPAAMLLPARSAAQAAEAEGAPDPADPGSGTLMLRGPGVARAMPAVQLGTDMDVTVSGSVARVRVTQAFRNTSSQWMEARYLYPLPQDGAVDSLKMVVGQRVIIGKIKKRDEARQIYNQAKASGRKAGLVEQQRPNMFTTHVANVGPGETVLIAIDYQAPVRLAAGTFSLRLPLVVGPRYVPPHSLTSGQAADDAATVTAAPILDPKLAQKVNPVSITVHLTPGFAPANIISPYHHVTVSGRGEDRTIRLADGAVPADRDFELDWRSTAADPTIGLFREHADDGDYVMAAIVPPADTGKLVTPPREMVFVIDNSGSMGGASMDEAKASLVHALTTLRPQDRFNVIRFDDTMTQLFTHSVAATPDQVAIATRFANGLQANGGTEMLPALKAALADAATSATPGMVRQIVFLTDGEVSNEDEMLATLGQDGGRSHVFLVGIGSAPNDYLMSRMASAGRGTYTHVGTSQEVAAKMTALLDILRRPSVQDLRVQTSGTDLDLTPRLLPDLYVGEPLVLLGRASAPGGTLTVSGTIGSHRWTQTVKLADAVASPAVAKLWARRRIDDVEADRVLGKIAPEAADAQIAEMGIQHGLVTRQTSLVAVDETPVRPAGETLHAEDLPINLPAGWNFDTLFGGDAGRAAIANQNTLAARAAEQSARALDLPQTATGYVATLTGGLLMLVLGTTGITLLRRRRDAK
jgi:Ca-activated chloride channel family protein